LLGDIGQTIWSFNVNGSYAATIINDNVLNLASSPTFTGPWSRVGIGGLVFGMNGQVKRRLRGAGLLISENWGLDTPDSAPQLATTMIGPNTAGTGTSGAGSGTPWSNPSNVTSAVSNATVALTGVNSVSNPLNATTFGFAIPAGSSIIGIQFSFVESGGGTAPPIFDTTQLTVQLLKAGVPVGTARNLKRNVGGPSFFGGSNDLWGVPWLTTDINAAGFGFQVIAYTNSNATSSWTIRNVQATITVIGAGNGTITKAVGRSYAIAWENANVASVGAPSPVSPFIPETNALNTIQFIEAGTVSTNIGVNTVQVNGATASAAWVNRHLWLTGIGDAGRIVSVNVGAGILTLVNPAISTQTNAQYQIFDEQATHIRLYATSDGGSVYFRIQRNVFVPSATDLVSAGLSFTDNDNSEPPNGEFTSEIEQIYNIPPPIGTFVQLYSSSLLVYGVPAAKQSFFYSNSQNTSVGLPWDSFAPLNQYTLPVGDASLNGMAILPTGLIIWSDKQDMFKVTGLLSDNTVSTDVQLGATVSRLPYQIGCASPYAVVVTSLGTIWFSSDRQVWLFTDNYAPKNIGRPIQDILNTANRLPFAKMKYYKNGDRSWVELNISTGASTFNNKKLILDIDLLTSNGQPSFFTFDMATNQPTWYPYDVPCEAVEVTPDVTKTYHTLAGDLDVITETDWTPFQVTLAQPAYFTIGAEQSVQNFNTLHALGNDSPELMRRIGWIRWNTNQLPKNLASQGWKFGVLGYDDDTTVLGVSAQTTLLIPGTDSTSFIIGLENSPAVFRFAGFKPLIGRRFQIQTFLPTLPGFWEFRSAQVSYTAMAAR
jgi:hypothetical protein